MGGFCRRHRVQPYWWQHVHVCLLTSPAATAGALLGWYNLLGTRKRRKSGPRVSVLQWKVYGTGNIRRFAYYTYTHECSTQQDAPALRTGDGGLKRSLPTGQLSPHIQCHKLSCIMTTQYVQIASY